MESNGFCRCDAILVPIENRRSKEQHGTLEVSGLYIQSPFRRLVHFLLHLTVIPPTWQQYKGAAIQGIRNVCVF